ncbi:MAG: hypothetical protein CM15mV34_1050 [Caudoviricetes sp.]|nr:MAG: hypothetical protein CM15mV34_1050 [Caudoviricetes sp.]
MTHPELDRVDEYDDEGLMKSLDARIQEIEEDDEDEGDGDVLLNLMWVLESKINFDYQITAKIPPKI